MEGPTSTNVSRTPRVSFRYATFLYVELLASVVIERSEQMTLFGVIFTC
jgi:hypothetical protein